MVDFIYFLVGGIITLALISGGLFIGDWEFWIIILASIGMYFCGRFDKS